MNSFFDLSDNCRQIDKEKDLLISYGYGETPFGKNHVGAISFLVTESLQKAER